MDTKDITPEQIEQITSANSIEELKSVAEEQGIDVTDEEIACVWETLHEQEMVKLSDDELENVAGGCGKPLNPKISDKGLTHWKCPKCKRAYIWNGKWRESAAPDCNRCGARMRLDYYDD